VPVILVIALHPITPSEWSFPYITPIAHSPGRPNLLGGRNTVIDIYLSHHLCGKLTMAHLVGSVWYER